MNEDTIELALHDCYDPEIPLNVVDLGRVERITVALDPEAPGAGIAGVPERYSVTVMLVPAEHKGGQDDEQSGALEAQLLAVVANRLAGLPELSRIAVALGSGAAWTPARISVAGRRRLGLDAPQFPILNNRIR